MPLYFFHISNGDKSYDDEKGELYPDAKAAEMHASVIARRLATGRYEGYQVITTDAHGNEISRVPIQRDSSGRRAIGK